MGRFLAQRLPVTLLVLWGVSVVTFLLVAILPGDAASDTLGYLAILSEEGGKALEALRGGNATLIWPLTFFKRAQ